MKLADQVERWLRNRHATVKLEQTFPCLGKMPTTPKYCFCKRQNDHADSASLDEFHNSRNINFITVADLTTSTDLESITNIHLSEVDINVDVFELHGDEEQVEPSDATRTRIAQDVDDDISRPQAKIMNLPNRNLHGVWDS